MEKRHPEHDPKLEAALDELDATLTADASSEVLQDVPETDEAGTGARGLLPRERRDKRKR